MNWSSWSEFIAMGGYAQYVWGSLGMVVLVLALEVIQLRGRAASHRNRYPPEQQE